MRTPSAAVRGVYVILIILGVVFISNIASVQSAAQQLLLDVPTPSPTPTATPLPPHYFPMVKNQHGYLNSSVVIANGQGFDNCKPLSVEGMQTWWDHSPYSTVNIYLGGISALCPFDELDYGWYTQVAAQGWTFILTWAGPQAPKGCPEACKFRYPMSTDPVIAYLEGKIEAFSAVEAASNLGFEDQLVIYYDVESYSGADEDTKAVVAEFIKGWTEQLHELGHFAGAYGAACTSYVVDWAFNDPPPDDVWVAQWNKEYAYDPDATVYDTTCLDEKDQPPIFWTNHQRIKQYTGPHNETWGDLTVKIDSDVLDGQVNALFGHPPLKEIQHSIADQAAKQDALSTRPILRDIQLLSPSTGWVLRGNQLLWSADAGLSWQNITPISKVNNAILGVHFENYNLGWIAVRNINNDGTLSLSIFHTLNAGETWYEIPLNEFSAAETWEIESASFDFLDDEVGWLALKLHSGINFSFGRLLATEDGGRTWEERELPLGEPVIFQDARIGWTAGGPLDQVYYTDDGGESWRFADNQSGGEFEILSSDDQQRLAGKLPQGVVAFDFIGNQVGWAVIQDGTCTGYKLRAGEQMPSGEKTLQCESSSRLVSSTNGGISWSEITPPE